SLSFVGALPSTAVANEVTRLVVGFPPGGVVDIVARTFAEHAAKVSGNTFIVENRPGASGKLAVDTVLKGSAEGTTLLVAPASMVELSPFVIPAAIYDPLKDLQPLGALAEYGFVRAAGADSGATTIEEYRQWATDRPEESYYATPGQGTPQHF